MPARFGLPWVSRTSVEVAAERPAAPMTPDLVTGPLRIGYVVWDWPALSQTFVLHEIQELQARGHDVVVYYKVDAVQPTTLTFDVVQHQVNNAPELVERLRADDRQVMHSPFAYPSSADLVQPAATETGIPYTFMAGGVDIADYVNMKRNRVGEVSSSPLCLGVITLGSFHRDLLMECGVPSHRIVMERQSAALPPFAPSPRHEGRPRLLSIARFIEKKGLEYLVRAAASMPEVDVVLHGYGPLEPELRELAAELGATNVDFAGSLMGDDALDEAYRSADLFVLPCVRAANGDLDGLPTVILEAMGAGVPVVTTDVANIPDRVLDGVTGFVAAPRDVDSLVSALRRALDLDAPRRTALLRAARKVAENYASARRTTDTLERLWRRTSLDIVLVTFDRKGYRSEAETFEIIDRILRFTSLPFGITVVDNDSDASFVRRLRSRYRDEPRVDVVALDDNTFCGPASNLGFGRGRAPYLVYVCANEGFVLRHGWDHQLARTLESSGAALVGYPIEVAAYRDGAGIQTYASFDVWRSPEFARDNPGRQFRHVQGGLFAARRDVFEEIGGFSPTVPHNGMDLELSYEVEATGHALAAVPGLAAITVKTAPKLHTVVDEFSVAVHPATLSSVGMLDELVAGRIRLCSVCGWTGADFAPGESCPTCASSPFTRTVCRVLSQGGELQSRPPTTVIARNESLDKVLRGLIHELAQHAVLDSDVAVSLATDVAAAPPGLLIVDRYWSDPTEFERVAEGLGSLAARGTLVVVGLPPSLVDDEATALLSRVAPGVSVDVIELVSRACAYDPYPVAVLGARWHDVASQGFQC